MTKKIINDPRSVVDETLEGFLAAHGEHYEKLPDVRGICMKQKKDKTALVIGGGSGHEPMFAFFVGDGLADAAACGNIFASPDPNTILRTAQAVDQGKGVLFVYGNYAGDNLNFDMAAELLESLGVQSKTVRVMDDVASAPKGRITDRRGIAGDFYVIKIAGAATAAGLSLEEAYRVTAKARDNVFSIGIALSGCTLPGEENPIFTLPEDEIEFGMGVHGEPGIKREKLQTADSIVSQLVEKILDESGIQDGDTVCTLVNGLGATSLSELYIINRKLKELLKATGISVYEMEVGSYITSQEMAGASITLFKLDQELKAYYDAPCRCPSYRKEEKK